MMNLFSLTCPIAPTMCLPLKYADCELLNSIDKLWLFKSCCVAVLWPWFESIIDVCTLYCSCFLDSLGLHVMYVMSPSRLVGALFRFISYAVYSCWRRLFCGIRAINCCNRRNSAIYPHVAYLFCTGVLSDKSLLNLDSSAVSCFVFSQPSLNNVSYNNLLTLA